MPRDDLLYAAAICLVLAQILGIYALWTRKADFIFALLMAILVLGAAGFAAFDVYHRIS